MIEPVVNRIENDFSEQLVVLRVNIQSATGIELSSIYGSRATPTFIFFDAGGQEAWRMIGTLDEDRVIQSLAEE